MEELFKVLFTENFLTDFIRSSGLGFGIGFVFEIGFSVFGYSIYKMQNIIERGS